MRSRRIWSLSDKIEVMGRVEALWMPEIWYCF